MASKRALGWVCSFLVSGLVLLSSSLPVSAFNIIDGGNAHNITLVTPSGFTKIADDYSGDGYLGTWRTTVAPFGLKIGIGTNTYANSILTMSMSVRGADSYVSPIPWNGSAGVIPIYNAINGTYNDFTITSSFYIRGAYSSIDVATGLSNWFMCSGGCEVVISRPVSVRLADTATRSDIISAIESTLTSPLSTIKGDVSSILSNLQTLSTSVNSIKTSNDGILSDLDYIKRIFTGSSGYTCGDTRFLINGSLADDQDNPGDIWDNQSVTVGCGTSLYKLSQTSTSALLGILQKLDGISTEQKATTNELKEQNKKDDQDRQDSQDAVRSTDSSAESAGDDVESSTANLITQAQNILVAFSTNPTTCEIPADFGNMWLEQNKKKSINVCQVPADILTLIHNVVGLVITVAVFWTGFRVLVSILNLVDSFITGSPGKDLGL